MVNGCRIILFRYIKDRPGRMIKLLIIHIPYPEAIDPTSSRAGHVLLIFPFQRISPCRKAFGDQLPVRALSLYRFDRCIHIVYIEIERVTAYRINLPPEADRRILSKSYLSLHI